MRKAILLITMLALIVATSMPALAYDETGRLGLGYRFGFHTLAKSPWKLRWMHGGEVKFGVNKWLAVGVTGTYGRTTGGMLATQSGVQKFISTDKKDQRDQFYNYIVEMGPWINLTPEKKANVYVTAGAGVRAMSVKDPNGDNVVVNPIKGAPFKLTDQNLSLMIGAGVEYFLIEQFSVGVSARYHAFTSAFSQLKDDKNVDESDHLDLPKGMFEAGAVVTAYFGKCKDDDKDGVCNEVDKCPDTPAGCKVDENGCPIDSDGDGVCDGLDKCPNTPKCAKVDINGCPMDSDNDGVYDGCDKCPNTPAGCKVDADGCPYDTDKDGVPDCLDKCPDTQQCCKVDANGCPIDSDNDGVCDGCDKCPGTPAGYKVDATGCPEGFTIEKELVLKEVQFVVNTWTLTDKAKKALDEVAKSLAAFPHVNVEIQGHTDTSGKLAWNQELSQKRAEAVVDYLVTKNLDRARFTAKGYGPDKPKYDNKTAEGRAQNRRVEMVRLND